MYPPAHHVETDMEKSYRVIEEFKFATIVNRTEDDVVVTQLPLILDRNRGEKGVLTGHLDRSNPHASHITEGRIFAIFHGPDAYISPNVYSSSQLPTWNSISVHVRGKVRLVESPDAIRDSLIKMTEVLENRELPFVLDYKDPRMNSWLHLILGFEIEIEEIVGRFKLSQDKTEKDMLLARDHLVEQNYQNHDDLLSALLTTSNKSRKADA